MTRWVDSHGSGRNDIRVGAVRRFGLSDAIGAKHKYDTKSDRWYVILDCIQTDNPIDGLSPLVWPWMEDENEAQASQQVAKMFNSNQRDWTVVHFSQR